MDILSHNLLQQHILYDAHGYTFPNINTSLIKDEIKNLVILLQFSLPSFPANYLNFCWFSHDLFLEIFYLFLLITYTPTQPADIKPNNANTVIRDQEKRAAANSILDHSFFQKPNIGIKGNYNYHHLFYFTRLITFRDEFARVVNGL